MNVWHDGFDSYAVVADLSSQGYGTTSLALGLTTGRFGGGGITVSDGNYEYLAKSLTYALELWVGVAIHANSTANADRAIATFISSAGVEGYLTFNPVTKTVKAWRGLQNTLLGSAIISGFANLSWGWWDIHYKYSTTVGVFEVWFNGVQVLNLTAQNTAQDTGQTALSTVSIASNAVGGGQPCLGMTFDDLVINDTTGTYNNGRQGDSRIETVTATSDATPNNGTPSTAGSHYPMVDEAQWNTTNYITMTNTSGQEELFGMGALSGTPSAISALRVVLLAENTDAGTAALESVVVSSATELDGASTNLTSSWGRYSFLYEYDPHTSAAWTAAAVNAAQIGWKVP